MGTLTRNSRGLLDVLLENDSLTGSLFKKSSLSVFSTWHDVGDTGLHSSVTAMGKKNIIEWILSLIGDGNT